MTEIMADEEGVTIINDTDVDTAAVFRALADQDPEAAALVRWSNETRLPMSRRGSLVDRDSYVTPNSTWDQMRLAYHAAENDDVVAGVLEMTEALAFGRVSVDTDDPDETNIWNQISEDLDLELRLREMWREDFTVSQVNVAMWWGKRDYTVSGKSEVGTKRKKKFAGLNVPVGMTILDPLKVVPVGNLMFNKEQLAYCADNVHEYDQIRAVIDGRASRDDPMIRQLMVAPYEPDEVERRILADDGINPSRLYLMNPNNVWRHNDTRSQYQRFATVRMKSIFELLDLKHQLRAMDRAHLLGGTNFIVLIKKGDKERPPKPGELSALSSSVRNLSRVPVIVGDDRLSIEIITPNNDKTLQPERYNGIDARITARLYQMFMTGNFASGAKGDDSIKLAKMVARGLESRRGLLKRTIDKRVLMECYRRNDALTSKPALRFHPKRIGLDFDPTYAQFVLDVWDRGLTANESLLEEIDYDLETEVRRRKAEKPLETLLTPRAAPGAANLGVNPQDPKSAGRTAGRRLGGVKKGGGAAPGSGQGQEPKDARNKSDDK